jgi:hypothetical protein
MVVDEFGSERADGGSADANGPSHGPFESREAAEKDAEATLLGADCKGDKRRPIEHHAAIAFRQASFDLI